MGFSLVSLYWPLSVPTEGSSQRELLCPCSFTSSPVVSWLLQPRAAASLDHSTSWPHVGDEGKHPPLGKEGVKRGQKNTKHSGDKWLVLTVGGYGPGLCSPDQRQRCEKIEDLLRAPEEVCWDWSLLAPCTGTCAFICWRDPCSPQCGCFFLPWC